MKVTLLGTGGPRPDPDRQGPATLVEAAGSQLLFDAGRGVSTQLVRAGVHPADLDAIFLTHHHYDHIGAVGDVIMSAWNEGRDRALPVFGPRGTQRIVDTLLDIVFAADIRFRIREAEAAGHVLESPRAMVVVQEVHGGSVLSGAGFEVTAAQVDHGGSLGLQAESWRALGYRVESEGRTVALSGDAVASNGLLSLASGADALVMCCYLATAEIDSPDLEFLATDVLASAPQVGAIAAEADVGLLVLTHFRQKSAEMLASIPADVAVHYSGPVVIGEDLLALDV